MPGSGIRTAATALAVVALATLSACGGGDDDGGDNKSNSPSDSAGQDGDQGKEQEQSSEPLTLQQGRKALLGAEDFGGDWKVGNEDLSGDTSRSERNLEGVKGNARCNSFIEQTNKDMGTPEFALKRDISRPGKTGGQVNMVLRAFDGDRAKHSIRQMDEIAERCGSSTASGDGLPVTYTDWKKGPAGGDESAAVRGDLMGMDMAAVLVRVGDTVVETSFMKGAEKDHALVEKVTRQVERKLQDVTDG